MTYSLPTAADSIALPALLPAPFTSSEKESITEHLIFYDTFDWRLYTRSLVLVQEEQQLFLRPLHSHTPLAQASGVSQIRFADDLPAGRLAELVSPIIAVRALLPCAQVEITRTVYPVRNEDKKMVARLSLEMIRPYPIRPYPTPPHHTPTTQLHLTPIRGYTREAAQIHQHLLAAGFSPTTTDLFFTATAVSNQTPGGYTSRQTIPLEPEMPADEATKRLLRFLLTIIQQNLPYIEQDIDTEFLHDFRIAVRSTRALLGQMKAVFPADITTHFQTEFKNLGQLTNKLRDLDVYLLHETQYRQQLPDLLQSEIAPLFDYLREKQTAVLQEVSQQLQAPALHQTLADWQHFLHTPTPESETAVYATTPIQHIAQQRIYRRYRRVVTYGRRILQETDVPDEHLHNLRIECKKLRYLMEFFAPLFAPKEINRLLKQLKLLQDNLGQFNDYCIQETYLLQLADELSLRNRNHRRTLVAIGSLIGAVDEHKQQVKAEFAHTFTQFSAPKNKKLFRQLFAADKKGKRRQAEHDNPGTLQQ
jgi:CHAD domain-containing protein